MKMQWAAAALSACAFSAVSPAAAPTGGFFVHLNQQNTTGNSDSRRSVTFYDADDLTGAASPLFSVHIPGEQRSVGNYNGEEADAIATDPTTGDVYVLSFDSGTAGVVDSATGDAPTDTEGDLDVYKIDFQSIYQHWSTNFQGTTVARNATTGVGGVAPFVPAGAPAGGFNDYITYGSQTRYGTGLHFDDVNRSHSNTFDLSGAVQKIAEVKRNAGAGDFFDFSLEFVDSSTLVLLDDSSVPNASETAATDHAYRLIERVSTSPGAANSGGAGAGDGGFNLGTTQSWNSRIVGRVNLDFASGAPTGHSEPESMAYHSEGGVRGFWVTESDSSASTRGDDVAFWDIDLGRYREHAVGSGPTFPTSFALDNDPSVDSSLNDGQADHIFTDADTGDIIIVESGFGDAGIASVGADHEPSVIRREVVTYDDGAGRIQFGAWSEKRITNPNPKDTGSGALLERGHWAAYDSVNDKVYFLNPGAGTETPAFQVDLMVLDVATGVTTNVNNIDESVSLFFGDSFGDVADFFFLAAAPSNPGDFNDDGLVNSADYTVWRDNLNGSSAALNGNGTGAATVVQADYDLWVANYNTGPGSATAIPEPAALVLATLAACGLGRRRNG
ncbi:MAG: hypothetical protein ACRCT8_07385 [Lacipirellulaceae bacterium]